ncbi:MAG: collagen-like protein [Actinomycetota bacterium]|nr:collagen-like protein [Actinomycetota bacterium]
MSEGMNESRERGTDRERRFRITPATVLAGLALFVALGGTSIAASGLINGKKIKPGTVTAKQIKNKTITTSKLSPKTFTDLRGATGPAGAPGAKGDPGVPGSNGATGPTGATGPAAISAAYQDESLGVAFPSSDIQPIAELELPAGRYMVTGKVELRTNEPSDTSCWIAFDHDDYLDSARWRSPGGFDGWGTISLLGISPADTETLTLTCSLDDAGQTGRSKIVAVPVAG